MNVSLTALVLVSCSSASSGKAAREADLDAGGVAPLAPVTLPPPDAAASEQPITIAAVGDIMLGSTYPDTSGRALPANDGATFLDEVAPTLSAADIAFGNLEAPLFDDGDRPHCTPGAIAEKNRGRPGPKTCWAFRTPSRYGKYLADAGFDVLSLANNHIDDFGPEGRAATLETLDKLGIRSSGPTGSVANMRVRGHRVVLIAFATNPGLNDLDDLGAARALVARSAASADIVVVSLHGGAEGPRAARVPDGPEIFHGESRGSVRSFARAVVESGADLVLGHGPHVVRGMEVYRDRLIAYSLGSFATHRGISVRGVRGRAMILEVSLATDGRLVGGRVVPILQRRPSGPRLDQGSRAIEMVRRLSRLDFGDRAVRLSADGRIELPGPNGSRGVDP